MVDCSKTEVFFKELNRMCSTYGYLCTNCGIHLNCNSSVGDTCGTFIRNNPLKAVEIVQKWSDEHPIKTRQSEFLKLFPDAKITDGRLNICPKLLDTKIENCPTKVCDNCKKEYWLEGAE